MFKKWKENRRKALVSNLLYELFKSCSASYSLREGQLALESSSLVKAYWAEYKEIEEGAGSPFQVFVQAAFILCVALEVGEKKDVDTSPLLTEALLLLIREVMAKPNKYPVTPNDSELLNDITEFVYKLCGQELSSSWA